MINKYLGTFGGLTEKDIRSITLWIVTKNDGFCFAKTDFEGQNFGVLNCFFNWEILTTFGAFQKRQLFEQKICYNSVCFEKLVNTFLALLNK